MASNTRISVKLLIINSSFQLIFFFFFEKLSHCYQHVFLQLERSVKMVAEHEKEIYKLKRLVEEERKKSFMYISISFLFGTLLSLIFAVQVLDFFRLLW